MNRVLLAIPLILTITGCSSSHRAAKSAPADPSESVVRVDVVAHDPSKSGPIAGTVVQGARVATLLDSIIDADELSVVTKDGRRCRVAGVAGWDRATHVALLSVNWSSKYPPMLTTAAPAAGTVLKLRVLPPPGSKIQEPMRTEAKVGSPE